MNLEILKVELTHATPGPWQSNGQGMLVNSNTQKIIGFCSSDFDARLIVSLRNEGAELLQQLEDSYTEEQYTETCEEYDYEIELLKDRIDDLEEQIATLKDQK